MTRVHRRNHLWIWLFLTPIIIGGFYLALQAKREVPVENAAPIETTEDVLEEHR